jgi:uncharacterized damage-inducible protein DinB
MKAIDLIRWAMQKTDEWTVDAAEQLRDVPLVQPTVRGGNHALWNLGHLAVVEGSLQQTLFGEPNPVERWLPLFWQGSKPTTDAGAYPSFDEVLATYRKLHAENLARLDEIGDEGLDQAPASIPRGFENEMSTIGRTLIVITLHQMSHVGQFAVIRRAAGREPRF